jgi:hypothetical protein
MPVELYTYEYILQAEKNVALLGHVKLLSGHIREGCNVGLGDRGGCWGRF